MKRASKALLCLPLLLYSLSACASAGGRRTALSDTEGISLPTQTGRETETAQREVPEQEKETAQRESPDQEKETARQDAIEQEEETEPQVSCDFFADKEWDVPDEFTQEETDYFTDFMNTTENNGFLQSEYSTPADIGLDAVFYNGAGVSAHSLSEQEEAAYEEITGWEIETDVERLTTEELDRFLLRKTGYPYKKMNVPLNWTYLEQSDAYVSDHGDTNWREYRCIGGRKQGNLYEVYYQAVYHQDDDNGGVLLLKENGGDYLIVSNQWDYLPDLSPLSDQEITELTFFAQNRNVWNLEDRGPLSFFCTVFDLDQDGRPELITSAAAEVETAEEHHFYHTNDALTELEEVPQEHYDPFYAAMKNEDDPMNWIKTTPSQVNAASVKRLFRILTESYHGNRYTFY